MEAACRDLLKRKSVDDVFDVTASLSALSKAIHAKDIDVASVEHDSLLNKLASFMTMLQLAEGNPADILQMVRWQMELCGQLACSGMIFAESEKFVLAFHKRKATNYDYPKLIERLLDCFKEMSTLGGANLDMSQEIAEMEQSMDNLAALQSAHRNFLLKLQNSLKHCPESR